MRNNDCMCTWIGASGQEGGIGAADAPTRIRGDGVSSLDDGTELECVRWRGKGRGRVFCQSFIRPGSVIG